VNPPRFEPMLATTWRLPFADPEWWFEPKWDGIRGVITWDGSSTAIHTRGGNEVSARYPELAMALSVPCVLDGEIVSFDEGRPSFQRLQTRMHRLDQAGDPSGRVSFIAFDLLWLDGRGLTTLGLEERLGMLGGLDLPDSFQRTDPVRGDGLALWDAVVERDLEGMVAKRAESLYRPGRRSVDWRKIHHEHTARALVGGFTHGEGGRSSSFGSLVLGQWDGLGLRWVGNVGTGFDETSMRAVRGALDEMRRSTSPFHRDPEMVEATWVEPSLVAAVSYRNWTTGGRLRFPVFKGFTDEDPDAVTWETEGPQGRGAPPAPA